MGFALDSENSSSETFMSNFQAFALEMSDGNDDEREFYIKLLQLAWEALTDDKRKQVWGEFESTNASLIKRWREQGSDF
jgi:hypothetical protein